MPVGSQRKAGTPTRSYMQRLACPVSYIVRSKAVRESAGMSGVKSPLTVEQMWDTFWRRENPTRPGRKAPNSVRMAYYAGCRGMLDQILTMLEADSADWDATWISWSDELTRYSDEHNPGRG